MPVRSEALAEKHRQRHAELQAALEELVTDWMEHTDRRPSRGTVMDLIAWSHRQTIQPCPVTDGSCACKPVSEESNADQS